MLDQFKRIAKQTGKSEMPAQWMFGVVKSIAPLEIIVDERFPIFEDDVVLMKQFRTGQSYPTHQHTGFAGSPATRTASGGSGDDSFATHSHGLRGDYVTNSGEGSETYYGLKVGEKLVLFRNHGGQQFLVLGRM